MATILVVDDEPAVLLNTCAYLEDEGYDVVQASNEEEAISALKASSPDIGIIDMRLPGITGNELIIKLRNLDDNIQFIIHTGSTDYILPESLIAMGITKEQVINKPVPDMNVFINVINDLLTRKGS